jgi:hypothetical protein
MTVVLSRRRGVKNREQKKVENDSTPRPPLCSKLGPLSVEPKAVPKDRESLPPKAEAEEEAEEEEEEACATTPPPPPLQNRSKCAA